MKKEITSEDIIDVLHRGLDPNKYDMETSVYGSCNALKVIESGSEHHVLVTADTSVLPYYVDGPIEFESYDTYMVCYYHSDNDEVVVSFCETVKGLENVVSAVKQVFVQADLIFKKERKIK